MHNKYIFLPLVSAENGSFSVIILVVLVFLGGFDETPPSKWKLGDRVKIDKILVTIKHIESQEVEEGEFDIKSMEKELATRSHYSSTNRWVPTKEIKNGYVLNSRHNMLISDAVALDYIVF